MTGETQLAQEKPQARSALSGIFSEFFVANLLRYGVFISIGITAVGAILFFVENGLAGSSESYIKYSSHLPFPHTIPALGVSLAHGEPFGIIAVGLLLLVFLRVFQVFLTIFTSLSRRDYKFAVISLFVTLVLLSSLFLGKAGG